ncbi:hypothetical protein [Herbidospora sp. RD11066]
MPLRLRHLAAVLLVFATSCTAESPKVLTRDEWVERYSAYAVGLAVTHPDHESSYFSDYREAKNTLPSDAPTAITVELPPIPGGLASIPSSVTFPTSDVGEYDRVRVAETGATRVFREEYLKGTGRSDRERRKVERFLHGLDKAMTTSGTDFRKYTVALLVELDEPLTIRELEPAGLDAVADRVLFSTIGSAGLPLSWSGENCQAADTPACDGVDEVDQFRAWLESLTPAQLDVLGMNAFDLPEMRRTAADGRISGLMVDRTTPGDAWEIARNPHVRAAYVVGIVQSRP